MKIENQVTSLELSKKLKSLGVKQESLFWWNQIKLKLSDSREKYELSSIPPIEKYGAYSPFSFYSAPTVAELGEMLELDKILNGKIIVEKGTASKDWYVSMESGGRGVQFRSHTEANARAKMLIYLLENKLISLDQAISAISNKK